MDLLTALTKPRSSISTDGRDGGGYGRCSWLKQKRPCPGSRAHSWSPPPGGSSRPGTCGSRSLGDPAAGGRARVRVPAGPAGGGAAGDDAAVLLAGAAALVPVHVGVGVPWNQATRSEARDFCRRLQLADKPGQRPAGLLCREAAGIGEVRAVDGRALRDGLPSFYAYHLEAGTGPIVNPFPLARPGGRTRITTLWTRSGGRRPGCSGRGSPRFPRQIPDRVFNELFAGLPSNRDRALVAFWVSTGARASELLGVTCSGADPGQQLITVIRKGSRAMQPLPASPDAFVWLRLYQQEMQGLVPSGPDDPLWWTLRRPFRPLAYHAARAMFDRANAAGHRVVPALLRHTAAYRLARDPDMPITDVQWVSAISPHDHANLRHADGRGRHREHAGPSPPAGRAPARPAASSGLPARDPGRAVREGPMVTARRPPGGCPGLAAQRRGPGGAGEVPAPAGPALVGCDGADRFAVVRRLLAPPFAFGDAKARHSRKLAMLKILDWLELHPGTTWQQRWEASGAGRRARRLAGPGHGRPGRAPGKRGGSSPTCSVRAWPADRRRRHPAGPCLAAGHASPVRLAGRWPGPGTPPGSPPLKDCADQHRREATFGPAVEQAALIMAAKGGLVGDITAGDCLELLDCSRQGSGDGTRANRHSSSSTSCCTPPGSSRPERRPRPVICTRSRAAHREQLIDRYGIACRPVRDLLVDYLRERQPGSTTAPSQAWPRRWRCASGRTSNPSPRHRLAAAAPDSPPRGSSGSAKTVTTQTAAAGHPRETADDILTTVRAFYLDIAHWARKTPPAGGRGPFPARSAGGHPAPVAQVPDQVPDGPADPRTDPCPARPRRRRRPRRDRCRGPAGRRPGSRAGELFTVGGSTAPARMARPARRIWAEDPQRGPPGPDPGGRPRVLALGRRGSSAPPGFSLEELTELSHHSLVQYRLPSTGELIPLLYIAPSKTDPNGFWSSPRSWPTSLSAVISRVRGHAGAVPLVAAYDAHECVWNPPMPLLFQRVIGLENRPITAEGIRSLIQARSPGPASPAPTASRWTSCPTISGGSSPPTPS